MRRSSRREGGAEGGRQTDSRGGCCGGAPSRWSSGPVAGRSGRRASWRMNYYSIIKMPVILLIIKMILLLLLLESLLFRARASWRIDPCFASLSSWRGLLAVGRSRLKDRRLDRLRRSARGRSVRGGVAAADSPVRRLAGPARKYRGSPVRRGRRAGPAGPARPGPEVPGSEAGPPSGSLGGSAGRRG